MQFEPMPFEGVRIYVVNKAAQKIRFLCPRTIKAVIALQHMMIG